MIPQPDLTEAYKHLHLSLTKIEKGFNTIHFTYTTKRTEMVKGRREKRRCALGRGDEEARLFCKSFGFGDILQSS